MANTSHSEADIHERATTNHKEHVKDSGVRWGLQLHKLSIRDFTDSPALSSINTGVVEIMVLHACDKCIYSKTKWLLAMDMGRNALQHMHPGMQQLLPQEDVQIVLENLSGKDISNVPDYSNIDPTLNDMALATHHQTAVFSRLLLRYNLWEAIADSDYPNVPKQPGDAVDWKMCSFTMLRKRLADHFATQSKPLSLLDINKVAIQPSHHSKSIPSRTSIVRHGQAHRDRSHTSVYLQPDVSEVIPIQQQRDATEVHPYTEPTSALNSPFTPLTHDILQANLSTLSPITSTLSSLEHAQPNKPTAPG
ncbi:hypothetical protein BATDEDRAFT_26309 [Batrachochytrium dendrobatidis JAM81]|uniref:Uncharacterized protein n=2 Tax=Batrachochytrium dendrobatidis TaxID=109871 RepID=F4P7F2_BATDJ|nr:uncharacterized protein BATDEDRAFT_26309 [Batrachochytrium dendrobatidis JAM81]EGF78904.1 hypothetical protein BATDEDRAFT_26309 [Batrachochytrium dendrobatidis JAM81]KAJ8325190.1 hypothetical protein O5D80_006140 [Batrachochytrium dendrobatidis]KAK5667347.1 hypothetical protein QVD99_005953 [Batrachochytrium dendrobatidis]OAJ42190.1 hypothetical protein BDEG_25680 [Batrachochytrium dendrobatidis JEL423]|eukprot:XP_006680356.1 hypothetical protein BATDEDRAFT_26309 [Batrachochytrium dendrobatidis JAM81]